MMGGLDNLFIETWGFVPTVAFAVVLIIMWWRDNGKGGHGA